MVFGGRKPPTKEIKYKTNYYTYLWRGFHLRPHRDDSVAFRHRRKRSASVCLRLIKKLFPNPQSSREGGCAHKKVNAVVFFAGFLVSFLKEAKEARYSDFRQNGCFFLLGKNNLIRSRVSKKIRRERKKKARDKSEKHRLMSGATTRVLQKRVSTMIGDERDSLLWDVVVSNDDICFQHILPRLNQTDIKFLYDVNGETRALVKRSSRKGDLKKGFRVRKMSSISTLEFAWENKSLWPSDWDETSFSNHPHERIS